jgi:nicotinate-nucleotide pyrophosphorylase (carboxylating)
VHGRIQSSAAVLIASGKVLPQLPADLPDQVSRALREDIGSGDITAELIPAQKLCRGHVLCRQAAILCGVAWFNETFRQLDPAVHINWLLAEGAQVAASSVLCELRGPARSILTAERTALNFLQLLSATATITHQYVQRVDGTSCRILDTRKTIPGLRTAQKYAVRCGGGKNHRLGLYDMVLIKENHIAAAGSIGAAVLSARTHAPNQQIEVETETLDQVREALEARADIIMLDNFDLAAMKAAVTLNRSHANRALLESSGGVTIDGLRAIAQTGVDFISVGSITKNIAAIDLSLRFDANA